MHTPISCSIRAPARDVVGAMAHVQMRGFSGDASPIRVQGPAQSACRACSHPSRHHTHLAVADSTLDATTLNVAVAARQRLAHPTSMNRVEKA